MTVGKSKLNINTTAAKLRSIIWFADEGKLLGSEDDLIRELGVSRPTLRQAARLLEREGLLFVRRGINGGYFAARPSVEVIEASVSAYLRTVESDEEELSEIAAALWEIMARKAATKASTETVRAMDALRGRIVNLSDNASFDDMLEVEEASREVVFKLVKSPYVELIFHINRIFATQRYPFTPGEKDNTEEHIGFIKAWKKAKLLEVEAIANHDPHLAELAAKHTRNLFHRRLWGHGIH